MNPRKNRIYLDYAATTPVDPAVFAAMKPHFREKFGNPGSVHSFGQEAIAAVDVSRETIARVIGAEFREIIFTGSATEANNLAIRGIIRGAMSYELQAKNDSETLIPHASCFVPRIIVSAIEHESILETARELEKDGVEVIYLPVDKNGVVDLRALKASLNDRTVLVSIMYANNEIGTIQPVAKISEIINNFKETRNKRQENSNSPFTIHHSPFLHVDAVQAFQFLDCDVQKLGVDMMTLSAHKIYGPKGIGCLYISEKRHSYVVPAKAGIHASQVKSEKEERVAGRKFTIHHSPFTISPFLTGGGQEFGLRSGTENVPSIVGFAKAVELAVAAREKESKRIMQLRDHLWRGIKKIFPKAEVNGASQSHSPFTIHHSPLLPNILNVYFPGNDAQDILTHLDLQGIAASSGSACRARAIEPSHVITALGYSKQRAKSSVRFSFGRPTTKKEIYVALAALRRILKR